MQVLPAARVYGAKPVTEARGLHPLLINCSYVEFLDEARKDSNVTIETFKGGLCR